MALVQQIMVPLDGSALAEQALPSAELLATRTKAQIIVLRAAYARSFPGVDPTEAQVRIVREAEEYVEKVAGHLRERGLSVDTAVPYGTAGEAIVEAAERRGADLIVMTTHGRSGLGRWVYGSVADHVLRTSTCPVLLLRAATAPSADTSVPETIVAPLDGSAVAEAVLPWVTELAHLFLAKVVFLRAVEPPWPHEGGSLQAAAALEAAEAEARAYLHSVAERLRADGIELVYEVRAGLPAAVITGYARTIRAQLIVMATHGRSGLSRLVYGSVAEQVLRDAPAPVLLVPVRSLEVGRIAARAKAEVSARDAAFLAAPASVTLTGRQVLLLRQIVQEALQRGSDDQEHAVELREILSALPSAEGLRACTPEAHEAAPTS